MNESPAHALNPVEVLLISKIFEQFATQDQRGYYDSALARFDKVSEQVVSIRALLATVAAVSSAVVVCISAVAQTSTPLTPVIQWVVVALALVSIAAPAFAGWFNMMADLYQWERLRTMYEQASESIDA